MTAARLAVATIFFVCGAGLANWVARIPAVQAALELGPGALGLALLGIAVGALIALPSSGWLIGRFGSRRVVVVAGIAYCLGLPLPALASGLVALMAGLIVVGYTLGVLDVSMNTQGVAVEHARGRATMSLLHALFSFGSMAGAATGGLAAAANVSPLSHLVATALILAAVVLAAAGWLLPSQPKPGGTGPALRLPGWGLAALGAVAFCSMLGEGAVADWSAVYLASVLETGAGLAASGFATYSLAVALARLVGDRLTDALGPARHVRIGGLLVALGIAIVVVAPAPSIALVGFSIAGLGHASIVPIVFSAAGRARGMSSGAGIAAVATVGYTGFLVGPPAIGGLAEVVTLRLALAAVAVLSLAIVALARSVDGDTAIGG